MKALNKVHFIVISLLGVVATAAQADAACEIQYYQTTNLCTTSSKIQLDPSVGFPNDFWIASLNGSGLSQAFANLRCEAPGTYAQLFSGVVSSGDYFECGQGSAINYPVALRSQCGTDTACQ